MDHVLLYHIIGVGFDVSTASTSSAQQSGPYTNITFDSGGSYGGVCAKLGASGTRGIHGLTCISETNAGDAVYVDSSNNSLEDILIKGFFNGIVVGAHAQAHGNVLINVYGDTTAPPTGATVNVVNISTTNAVTDLSIIGIANPYGGTLNNTINDNVTSTALADNAIAMYILGEASSGGYSRFTTSQNAVTWAAGRSGATLPSNCSTPGSLYSDTTSSGPTAGALYVCKPGSPNAWTIVP